MVLGIVGAAALLFAATFSAVLVIRVGARRHVKEVFIRLVGVSLRISFWNHPPPSG